MIFRELTETEIKILKLLRIHLVLRLSELLRYMQFVRGGLDEALLHLEREGLVTAKGSYVFREYTPTAEGLSLLRKEKETS